MGLERIALTVIYAIRRSSDGAIKIGRSREIEARQNAISYRHGPVGVNFTHPVDGDLASEIEEGAHALAVDYWLKGEWFLFPDEAMAPGFIKTAASLIASGETIDCSRIRKLRGQRHLVLPRNVTSATFRAARYLLGWSMRALADSSGVGLGPIRRFEQEGKWSNLCLNALLRTLKAAGVEFIPGGVRINPEREADFGEVRR